MIFWFLQFQPEFFTSIIINSQRFDYSAVVYFRAHLQYWEYMQLKYNNQVTVNNDTQLGAR